MVSGWSYCINKTYKKFRGQSCYKKKHIFFRGRGPKQSLFNRPLTPREISTSFGPGTKGGLRDLTTSSIT